MAIRKKSKYVLFFRFSMSFLPFSFFYGIVMSGITGKIRKQNGFRPGGTVKEC